MSLGETAWVDRNMRAAWDRIEAKVPEDWMPRLLQYDEDTGEPYKKRVMEEFACGHYGCVMPTNEEGLVFKITSDITEARFVVMAMELDDDVTGIVDYKKIFALRGQQHRKRPVFVLWRDEAWDVGFMRNLHLGFGGREALIKKAEQYNIMPGQVRSLREGEKYLETFLQTARDVREKMAKQLKKAPAEQVLQAVEASFENYRYDDERDPRHYRGIDRIGVGLARCMRLAELMANTDVIYPVGSALEYYLENGILLADVHFGNIGLDAERHLIITDPGHAVPFASRWAKLPEVPYV